MTANDPLTAIAAVPLRLDLGCGKNKKPGFLGVDAIAFEGVDVVTNLAAARWPWEDGSVEEVHCSHFLEHLTNLDGKWERIHFFNELWRVLKVDAKCSLVLPHWASTRYYGDPTHKEPFSEMGFYYLNKSWREQNAPHTDVQHSPWGYACHFDATWGYSLHAALSNRNQEFVQFAIQNYKEACQDVVATLVKKALP